MRNVVAITLAVVASVSLSRQLTGQEDFGSGLALVRDGLVSDATAADEATEKEVKDLLVEEWGAKSSSTSKSAAKKRFNW